MLFEIIGEEAIILEWKGRDPFTAFSLLGGRSLFLVWKGRSSVTTFSLLGGRSLFLHRKVDRPAVSGIVSQ
jgi:hypothetical protein